MFHLCVPKLTSGHKYRLRRIGRVHWHRGCFRYRHVQAVLGFRLLFLSNLRQETELTSGLSASKAKYLAKLIFHHVVFHHLHEEQFSSSESQRGLILIVKDFLVNYGKSITQCASSSTENHRDTICSSLPRHGNSCLHGIHSRRGNWRPSFQRRGG